MVGDINNGNNYTFLYHSIEYTTYNNGDWISHIIIILINFL